ncbi:unnamed protein product [Heterosigma akashiwo]|mmetsp:Transcript_3569/g.5673  ORF Transcript_3569/g.5673 Transcript_3569/m.5673 type:complete len:313 (-) Transcript_3569:227-1165(-)
MYSQEGHSPYGAPSAGQTVPSGPASGSGVPPPAPGGYQGSMYQGWTPGAQQEQMLNMATGAGKQMIQSGIAKYMPGMHLLWTNMKFYFAVNNRFVVGKLRVLACPFVRRPGDWARLPADQVPAGSHTPSSQTGQGGAPGGQDHDATAAAAAHAWAKPWADLNCPDLYLPSMALVTFVLLAGYARGRSHRFSPETLVDIGGHLAVVELLEVLALRLGLYLLRAPADLLELAALSGYKYVGLCMAKLVALLLTGWPSYLASTYLGAAMAFFMLKSIAYAVPHSSSGEGEGLNREIVIIGFAALHLLMFCWVAFF